MSSDVSLCFLPLLSALEACLRCHVAANGGQRHMSCPPRVKSKRQETSFL